MWHVSSMWGSCKILLVMKINIFDGDRGSYKKKLKNATATCGNYVN